MYEYIMYVDIAYPVLLASFYFLLYLVLSSGFSVQASLELVEKHYVDLKSKPFYKGLCAFISSAPVFPMVWEGKGVVATGRTMLGETDPVSIQGCRDAHFVPLRY